MRLLVMFITAVFVLFLIKLRWPKNKSILAKMFLNLKLRQKLALPQDRAFKTLLVLSLDRICLNLR